MDQVLSSSADGIENSNQRYRDALEMELKVLKHLLIRQITNLPQKYDRLDAEKARSIPAVQNKYGRLDTLLRIG